jgi:hypothetical protein
MKQQSQKQKENSNLLEMELAKNIAKKKTRELDLMEKDTLER